MNRVFITFSYDGLKYINDKCYSYPAGYLWTATPDPSGKVNLMPHFKLIVL